MCVFHYTFRAVAGAGLISLVNTPPLLASVNWFSSDAGVSVSAGGWGHLHCDPRPGPQHQGGRPPVRLPPNRHLLLDARAPVPAVLHLQVQSDRGRGPEEAVTPGVSQRLAPWRSSQTGKVKRRGKGAERQTRQDRDESPGRAEEGGKRDPVDESGRR